MRLPNLITVVFLLRYYLATLQFSSAQDFPQDFLNALNTARSQVGVGPLTWDNEIEGYAMNYANNMADYCQLVHSNGPYGETIAWSNDDNLSGLDAVNMWIAEKADYDCISNTSSYGKVCGHYTQVVWEDSVLLGCAKVRCNNGGTFISCNYDPPGNVVGQSPYRCA